jgi:ATP-binding cassette subfamily F protein 3
VIHGHNVEIGYYAQNQDEFLDDRLTVFQTLDQIAEGEVRKHIRSILGAFLFQGEDVDKRVGVLSGGERSRLALARLLLHPYNMLILDEPTNHLDMRSKEVLKNALKEYPGTLLVISHDRDFMDGLVSKVYEFKNHQINEHIGGIYEFLRKRQLTQLNDLNAAAAKSPAGKKESRSPGTRESYEKRKEHNKKIRKVEKDIEKTERRIEALEEQIGEMDRLLANPEQVGDHELYARYDQIRQEHEQQMAQWEKLHARLETLNQQQQ